MEPICTPQRSLLAHRGVTVVELLVVLGIIGILVVVVVTGQGTFNKSILLNYTVYDVALTIRSAETYGLGSRAESRVQTDEGEVAKNAGYGVHFTPNSDTFLLFADVNPPGSPDPTGNRCHPLRAGATGEEPDSTLGNCFFESGEEVETYRLGNGMRISELWWYTSETNRYSANTLSIVFARPNPEAFISNQDGHNQNVSACVGIISPQGTSARIVVRRTGQIYVNSGSCSIPL